MTTKKQIQPDKLRYQKLVAKQYPKVDENPTRIINRSRSQTNLLRYKMQPPRLSIYNPSWIYPRAPNTLSLTFTESMKPLPILSTPAPVK